MSNKEIIDNYLNFYKHSSQSYAMRKSSLKYFFERFGYDGNIFDITTKILKDYFVWLKNLDSISRQTKKNKWSILTSFLNFTMEDYPEEFLIKIPSKTISWDGSVRKKGGVESNKNIYATIHELEKILEYFKTRNYQYYLIFRTFIETGARKGEILNLKISEVYLNESYLHPQEGKTDEKYYPITQNLANLLKIWVNERLEMNIDYNNLFVSKRRNPFSKRSFNVILKTALRKIGIRKNITCHTFRRTLNDYRKQMGCPKEDRKLLLGHTIRDINIKSYTRSDIIRLKSLYNKWNPYKDAKF